MENNVMFRLLRADEIECRIAMCKATGVQLLLYKDARCDQNILDETVGAMNWQRHHTRDNRNCIVSIWDPVKERWIEKEDTGTESNTEAEKGLASDSFKRACFNWGIGRELYTSPFIWFDAKSVNLTSDGKKCYDSFKVLDITYNERSIESVTIMDTKTKTTRTFCKQKQATKEQKPTPQYIDQTKVNALHARCKADAVPVDRILTLYKVPSFEYLTETKYSNINGHWEEIKRIA